MHAPSLSYMPAVLNPHFDRFATPQLVKDFYRAIQILISLSCSFFLAILIVSFEWIGPILFVIGFAMTPFVWFIANLAARVGLEFIMVLFAIHNNIKEIRHIAERTTATDAQSENKPVPFTYTLRREDR